MYCMAQLSGPWVRQSLQTHFGSQIFKGQYGWYGALEYDSIYGPIVAATATLFVWWLVCLWLYRQKLFVRI
jgi:predicted acyltransferase